MGSKTSYPPLAADDATATIAASATTSGSVDLSGTTLCGLYIPASFTGTAISFQACNTETGTYSPFKDGAGATLTKIVAAGDYIALDPSQFAGVRFLKIVSGSTEAAQRVITLAARPL